MLAGRRVVVVVPARDEELWIDGVLATLPAFVDGVVVIDDASTDRTSQLAQARGATVIRNDAPRGVGAAIVAGYRRALAMGADVVAVMAGDGQMCPDDLERVVSPVLRGEADDTKGDRLHHPDVHHTMPTARRVVGRALSALTAAATGVRGLSDSQSGYTAIHRRVLEAIDLDAVWPGYGYPNDLVGHVARAGFEVKDVVVRPVYRGERSLLRPRHVLTILGILGRAGALRAAHAIRGAHPAPLAPSRPHL